MAGLALLGVQGVGVRGLGTRRRRQRALFECEYAAGERGDIAGQGEDFAEDGCRCHRF